MTHLVIIGCGGHARSVADVALASGFSSLLFVDAKARDGESIYGFPVLTAEHAQAHASTLERYIAALGDNAARAEALAHFRRLTGHGPANVIAREAYVGRDVRIGEGVFVGVSAHLGPSTRLGDNVIINTRAIIEHEVIVGSHTHVAVNAIVLGRARVGERVLIGAGAIIRDGIRVASDVAIGAGAVVTADIHDAGIYAGVPARRL